MATAVALPVTAVLLVVATHAGTHASGPTPRPTPTAESSATGPVDLAAPPRSAAADRYCPDFVAALPITLDGLHARPAHSTSPWVGAWGDPPVTFRCGVRRPAGFGPTSPIQQVNGVQWYYRQERGRVVFTTVDRPVYVELTVPSRYAGSPLSEVTTAVARTLPTRPLDLH